ncbi:STAS domain-containing protein [Lutimaribacter sp. EGI FJ00015]|uniref:STAS domain-containing protein n=1 Tax=Lutimaribacter degradans TaxID=2945989 RepID=A0ACC5ZZ20_9RHOB|nr:STAS domain-containing protein [Lutimaribacter sp. EGI FJ00013]MCM2562794.1 STAS domain-containing protein [Lutimaribacter sp. EGI FJ00013]MCO0613951.1 STAS domain-containing protein [Lutimaribacter sp. EGI FJ00015]MCO0636923.1 STAS domain-containing protein [Lutimaribacter sp. EGI FJ00014]
MNLTVRRVGPLKVVDVPEKRIDAAAAIAFKDAMRDISDVSCSDLFLNLENVGFVDSSGLGAIVAAMKNLGPERRLHLVALSPAVEKVFRLTRMDSVFTLHDSIDAALADHG